jgi:Tol biopolymer transport system component
MITDASNPINLTKDPAGGMLPAWSPNGEKIAFARGGEIWVMNADGSGQTNLTDDHPRPAFPSVDSHPAWSPDGDKIAFKGIRDGITTRAFALNDIFVMDADGSNPTNLTNSPGSGDLAPAWSPDGTKIAFTSDRDDDRRAAIYVMDTDGSNPIKLTNNSAGGNSPTWSPDGTKVAFSSMGVSPTGNSRGIFAIDVSPAEK